MSRALENLFHLADVLATFENITHWAVSMRVAGKGNFIDRLRKGGDCSTKVYERTINAFSDGWPQDLEWPRHIPRPAKSKREAA